MAEENKKKMDAMQAKLDNYASEGFGKDEKHGDRNDSVEKEVRVRASKRVALIRNAEKLAPEIAEKFDSLSDEEVRKAVIKHRHANADLKGKSSTYIESRFDHMCEALEDSDGSEMRQSAGRSFLGARKDSEDEQDEKSSRYDNADPQAARSKMIKESQSAWASDLTAKKK